MGEYPKDVQRCCRCGAIMPAMKVESIPGDPSYVQVTNYICNCMFQSMVLCKNIGPDKDSMLLVPQQIKESEG